MIGSWLLDLTAAALPQSPTLDGLRRPRLGLRRGSLDLDRRDRGGRAGAGADSTRSTRASPRATSTTSPTRCSRRCASSSAATTRSSPRAGPAGVTRGGRRRRRGGRARGAELIAAAAAARVADRGALLARGQRRPRAVADVRAARRPRRSTGTRSSVFQVDERVAPAGDDDRNLTHLLASLPGRRAASGAPDAGRRRRPRGGGRRATREQLPTGSTSSTSASGPTATPPRWSRATRCSRSPTGRSRSTGEYQGRRRMTLTYPALEAARDGPLAGHRRRQARRAWRSCAPATRRSRPGRVRARRDADPRSAERRRATGPQTRSVCSTVGRRRATIRRRRPARVGRGRGRPPRGGRQPRREPDRIADLAAVVGDQAAVGRRRRAFAQRGVAELAQGRRQPEARAARAGSGRRAPSTGFEESAITTNRSAAAATIFSRVWAPPPPLTSQPSGAIWSAPSIAMSSRSSRVERLDREPELAGRLLGRDRGRDAADLELARGERRQQVGDGRARPSPTSIPSATSSAAASAARRFSSSRLAARLGNL